MIVKIIILRLLGSSDDKEKEKIAVEVLTADAETTG